MPSPRTVSSTTNITAGSADLQGTRSSRSTRISIPCWSCNSLPRTRSNEPDEDLGDRPRGAHDCRAAEVEIQGSPGGPSTLPRWEDRAMVEPAGSGRRRIRRQRDVDRGSSAHPRRLAAAHGESAVVRFHTYGSTQAAAGAAWLSTRKVERRGHPHQIREGCSLHLSHHMAAVRLHRNLTDAQLATDLLVRAAGDHRGHDLTLAAAERRIACPEPLDLG